MQANLVGQVCSGGTEEVFQRLRDFLCKRNGTYDYSETGIGWTLLDTKYTIDQNNCGISDYFVIYSPGEDGKRDLYFKITWVQANYLWVDGYLYWNPVTHSGNYRFYYTNNIVASDAGIGTLWIYGNLNGWHNFLKWGTNYYGFSAGMLTDLWYNNEIVQTTEVVSNGTDITIRLTDLPTTDWEIGKRVYIYDNNHAEMITITDRDSVLKEMKAQSLVYSYSIGAKICANLSIFLSGHYGYYMSSTYGYDRLLIGRNGTLVDGAPRNAVTGAKPNVINYMSPDPQNNDYSVIPISVNSAGVPHGYCGNLENIMMIDEINVVSEDVFSDGVDNWRAFQCVGGISTFVVKEV